MAYQKTLERYYKRRIKPSAKFIQQQLIRAKRALEGLSKPQRNRERERYRERSYDKCLRIPLDSKGFKPNKSQKPTKSYPICGF